METASETYDVRVRIEDDANYLYVGEDARVAMQSDALRQAQNHIQEAATQFANLDVTDIHACKALSLSLSLAHGAARALAMLARLPDEPDGELEA